MFGFRHCKKFEIHFHAFVSGTLPQEEADRISQHLVDCSRCSDAVEDFRAIQSAFYGIPDIETSQDFLASLESKIKHAEAEENTVMPAEQTDTRVESADGMTFAARLRVSLTPGNVSIAAHLVVTTAIVFFVISSLTSGLWRGIDTLNSRQIEQQIPPEPINIARYIQPAQRKLTLPRLSFYPEVDLEELIEDDEEFTSTVDIVEIKKSWPVETMDTRHDDLSAEIISQLVQKKSVPRIDLYAYRSIEERPRVLFMFGGQGSESSVDAGLSWLAGNQLKNGQWGDLHPGKDDQEQISTTALVLLSFLGRNYTHEKGPYSPQIFRGLHYLKLHQQDNGLFGSSAEKAFSRHALAMLAFAEGYGLTGDIILRPPLERAVRVIQSSQNRDGGWGERPGDKKSDPIVTCWLIAALRGTYETGIRVSRKTAFRAFRYLDVLIDKRTGMPEMKIQKEKNRVALAAALLYAEEMLKINNKLALKTMKKQETILLAHPPRWDKRADINHWYFGTLAIFNRGGMAWKLWNENMKKELLTRQVISMAAEESFFGSWSADGSMAENLVDRKPAHEKGRAYATAIRVLCLEVYFRYKNR